MKANPGPSQGSVWWSESAQPCLELGWQECSAFLDCLITSAPGQGLFGAVRQDWPAMERQRTKQNGFPQIPPSLIPLLGASLLLKN